MLSSFKRSSEALKAQIRNQNPVLRYGEILPFSLDQNNKMDLEKLKSRDYYHLIFAQKHQLAHTGPERWSNDLSLNKEERAELFRAVSDTKICKDPKLKEFQYKLIHGIVVKKRELFKYGISTNDVCVMILW